MMKRALIGAAGILAASVVSPAFGADAPLTTTARQGQSKPPMTGAASMSVLTAVAVQAATAETMSTLSASRRSRLSPGCPRGLSQRHRRHRRRPCRLSPAKRVCRHGWRSPRRLGRSARIESQPARSHANQSNDHQRPCPVHPANRLGLAKPALVHKGWYSRHERQI